MTPFPLLVYRGFAATLGAPLARWALRKRAARGKEDPARLGERLGFASIERPDGPLIWLHAASVGESMSLLPMIGALRAAHAEATLLVTTGTVTSAEMMARSLPEGVLHQFVPVDTLSAVRRFIAHWRPSLLCVVESELWPTMLSEAKASGARLALLSARVSEKSAARWSKAPRCIRALLGLFDVITAQDATVADRLKRLGAPHDVVKVCGSLKHAASKLPVKEGQVESWEALLSGRPRWLAASTHEGEETAAIAAHRALRARLPNLLTVIAPRHPERGDAVAAEIDAAGLTYTRRSLNQRPDGATDIHVVDSLGELGLWYRLSPIAFIGGSFVDVGGHNPLEAARLGSACIMGPSDQNMQGECARLAEAGALLRAPDAAGLVEVLDALFDNCGEPSEKAVRLQQAGLTATAEDTGVAALHFDALAPLFGELANAEKGTRDHAAA